MAPKCKHTQIVGKVGDVKILVRQPWLVWFRGLSTGLRTIGSLVRFPIRAHAWVSGWVPSRGRMRGNHTLMFLSLSPSLLLCLKINK